MAYSVRHVPLKYIYIYIKRLMLVVNVLGCLNSYNINER